MSMYSTHTARKTSSTMPAACVYSLQYLLVTLFYAQLDLSLIKTSQIIHVIMHVNMHVLFLDFKFYVSVIHVLK